MFFRGVEPQAFYFRKHGILPAYPAFAFCRGFGGIMNVSFECYYTGCGCMIQMYFAESEAFFVYRAGFRAEEQRSGSEGVNF